MEKTWLYVPFSEKEAAKALGAKWHPAQKLWYVPETKNRENFKQWSSVVVIPFQPIEGLARKPSQILRRKILEIEMVPEDTDDLENEEYGEKYEHNRIATHLTTLSVRKIRVEILPQAAPE